MSNFICSLLLIAFIGLPDLMAEERPNIIVILADDMGYSDLGCYGGEIETPNIDALAENGLRFKQFYNSARCCPTRASLMTGLHPHETGIGHMTNPPGTLNHDAGPDFPNYRGVLSKDCVTVAEVLKPAGYATLMSGKWHLGMDRHELRPLQRGFEKYYGCLSGATNFFYPEHPRGMFFGNEPIENPKSTTDRRFYTTDAFTDYAIQFLSEEKAEQDRPFFLYLAYTSPHWPLHAHQEEVQKYVGKYMMGWDKLREQRLKRQIEIGLIDPKWKLSERYDVAWDSLNTEKQREMDMRMAFYAAMIDRMDQNIGKLVEHLKKNDQYDNTLILFLTDNGGCAEGGTLGGKTDPFDLEKWEATYGAGPSYGGNWANASNTPFQKFKHYTHEGGISTPLVAHWPKGIKKGGSMVGDAAYLPDLMPTFISLAKAKYPSNYRGNKIPPLSGVSLETIFEGKSLKRKDPLYLEHEDNAALIQGDWKLVGTKVSVFDGPDASKWELYDLENDRTETNDLSATHPEKVSQLSKQWLAWANQVGVYPKPSKKNFKDGHN